MRIIELELINHLVIPEHFHIKFPNEFDMICIDGYNGSGKSFLINSIHPLSSNPRFKGKYSIRKGKSGLKRIVYEIDEHRTLEVIHEYIPKGNTHACKSFCNLIEFGVLKELNPTGHNRKFEEVIYDNLFFDSNTFSCCCISPNKESVVNATPTIRRNILESTMKSSKLLNAYQSNNRNILLEYKNTVKVFNRQYGDFTAASKFSKVEDYDVELRRLDKELSNANKHRSELNDKIDKLNIEIGAIERTSNSNKLKYINCCIEAISNLAPNETLIEISNQLDIAKRNLSVLEIKLNDCDNKLRHNSKEISIYNSSENLRSDINAYKETIKNITERMNEFNGSKTHAVIADNIHSIIGLYHSVEAGINKLSSNSIDFSNSDAELLKHRTIINDNKEFLRCYKEHSMRMENDPNTSGDIANILDNCKKCVYYNMFVKSRIYVEENRTKFNNISKMVDNSIEIVDVLSEINGDIKTLKRFIETLDSIMNKNFITRYKLGNIDNFIEGNKDDYLVDKLDRVVKLINDLDGEREKAVNTLRELEEEYSKLKFVDIESVNKEVIKLTNIKKELVVKIDENSRLLEKISNYKLPRGEFDSTSLNELIKTKDLLENKKNIITEKEEQIESLKSEIKATTSTIVQLINSSRKCEHERERLVTLNHNLLDASLGVTRHGLLSKILERKIPLRLLENNTEFIERTVNSIMEENEINLSLELLIENDEVRIPIFARDGEIPDITMASSGELCLLGMTLNAVIMNIVGYTVLSFDESDANLDVVYRAKFNNLLSSLLERLDIEQIFCISHNVSNELSGAHIILGDYDTTSIQGDILKY